MPQRLREFDFMRAFSALSVIAIHVTGRYVGYSNTGYFLNQSVRYAVPVFIILSGFLLSYSDSKKETVTYREFLSKRFNKIVIPYLIWSVIYILYNARHHLEVLWSNPYDFTATLLKALAFGNASYHLYFILLILQLYLLYPILRILIRKYAVMTSSITLVITLLFQTGIYLEAFTGFQLPRFLYPYYLLFPTWIFYFIFGMQADSMLRWLGQRSSLKTTALLTVLWLFSLYILFWDSKTTSTFELSVKPSVILYSFVSLFLMYTLSMKLSKTESIVGKFLDWVSKQSFIIYLSHILILDILVSLAYESGFGSILERNIGMLMLYISLTAATCAFSYLISIITCATYVGALRQKTFKG